MMDQINICVTVNSKYARYLYVMLLSLFESNRDEKVCLFVIHPDFTSADILAITNLVKEFANDVEFIQEDLNAYKDIPIHKDFYKQLLSPVIWYRLRLAEILPTNIERVILLDVDIIVNQSLHELFYLDIGDKFFAVAPNMCFNCEICSSNERWYEGRNDRVHFNIGVMLWNIRKIREHLGADYIINKAKSLKEVIDSATFDEEVFNVLFGENDIFALKPEKWNYIVTYLDRYENPNFQVLSEKEVKDSCGIIHYAGLNPWQQGKKNEFFKLWWEVCSRTPFYTDILYEMYWDCEDNINKLQNDKTNSEGRIKDLFGQAMGNRRLYEAAIKWNRLSLKRKWLSDYVLKKEDESVAIYGMGLFGEMFLYELRMRNINVRYGIDRNPEIANENIDVYLPDQVKDHVDVVVNTTVFNNEDILRGLPENSCNKIVSLIETLFELSETTSDE